jgi:hypothetical protein
MNMSEKKPLHVLFWMGANRSFFNAPCVGRELIIQR